MYIAIDFDGTIVTDNWPKIGEIAPFAIETIRQFKADGHKIILNTCREHDLLRDAVEFMTQNGIEPDFVNDNPDARAKWGDCKKVYADLYIDDHNAFIRKTCNGTVDWLYIRRLYETRGACDIVQNPGHYHGKGCIQAIDVIEAFDLKYNLGNAEKYILRAGKKDGNSKIQDLKKAAFYLKREIENSMSDGFYL